MKHFYLLIIAMFIGLISCEEKDVTEEEITSDTSAVEQAVQQIDTLDYSEIANKKLSEYVDPYNMSSADIFFRSVSAPEQYYLRTWLTVFIADNYEQLASDDESLKKLFDITFEEAVSIGKGEAEKNNMSAEDLKKSFDNQ